MNQSSSARTARNASRFVVTAGKPSLIRKRMTSPKIARVPVPVRSSRSTPVSSALRRMSRYWRTSLAPRAAVDAAADAQVPHHSVGSAEELTARVLQRTIEQRETRVARERDARRRRVGRLRLNVQLVVRERAIDETGIRQLELRVGELRAIAV